MKNGIFLIMLSSLAVLVSSCKKEENKIFFEGGTAPVLTATATGTIPLSFSTESQEAIKLSWTNPDYQFNTGLSSQDVSYLIEIDTTGSNFTNPKRHSISVSKDLSASFTVAQINDFLLNQIQLDSLTTHNLEIRVTSMIGKAVPLYSNVLQFTGVKPYAIPPKVVPPGTPPDFLDGKLYITGAATAGGWMGDNAPELVNQKFTRINKTLYEITVPLIGDQPYLFVPVYGNWSNKYGFDGANLANNVNGDNLKKEGGDMKAPAVSGTYKIQVDFQRGKFTLTKQ
jgi:hypothetical protein